MGRFFTRERFGRPQFLAGLLLCAFLGQCVWLVARQVRRAEAGPDEIFRVEEGARQWSGGAIAGTPSPLVNSFHGTVPAEMENNDGYDPNHSPLWYLIPSAPLLLWPHFAQMDSLSIGYWGWLVRAPYIMFGLLLGASLWYVARRLYGDAGGYIALTLYCFSPAILRSSTLWGVEPEMGAAWGAFGAIFTAIAVSHTLYAPREVVLFNWRRTLLLALSLALAVGCQFSLITVVPLALGFMLYLAPARRAAAAAIWVTACLLATCLIWSAYAFHPTAMLAGLGHASFLGVTWPAFGMLSAYRQVGLQLVQSSPALVVALPVSLIAYFSCAARGISATRLRYW